MRSWILVTTLAFLAPLCSMQALAADWTVAADGSGDFPTIQAAVDAANLGDTVILLGGTFTGPGNRDIEIDFDLTIRSLDPDDPSVIDCQGSAADPHRAFMIWDGLVDLSDLVIRNGYADNGGAVFTDGGLPVLNHCRLLSNTATMMGGAVHADSGDPVVFNFCIFAENTAAEAGGAAYAGAYTELRFVGCTLFRNESPAGSGVFLFSNASGRLNNTIIAFGRGSSACSDYYSAGFITGCTDIYANQGGDWTGVLAGQGTINNNANVDPQFCDPMGQPANFGLMPDSPVGEAYICGVLGAGATDPAWPAPVYRLLADGSGMYPTIQAAAEAVPFEAVISLADGIYTGAGNRDVELRGKSLTVEGRNTDPTAVVIDIAGTPTDPHRAFRIHEGEPETTTLQHLTIRNGYCDVDQDLPVGGYGGAVWVSDGSGLRVLSCRFENNTVHESIPWVPDYGKGGAIFHDSSGLLQVEGCTFIDNLGYGTLRNESGPLQVSSSTFSNDLAGIVSASASTVEITGCVFENYRAVGLQVADAIGSVQVQLCEFRSNTRIYWSAAFINCDSALIDQCLFEEVVTERDAGLPMLGFQDSQVTVQATTFAGNGVPNRGAVSSENSNTQFVDCGFTQNTGIWSDGTVSITGGIVGFHGCTFADNSFEVGGAIRAYGAEVSLTQCVLTGNQAVDQGGGGHFTSSTITITGTDFLNNTAADGGGLYAESCNLTVADCNFDANSDGLRHHGSSLGGVTITGTTFANHAAGWAAEIDSMLIRPVRLDDCTFSANNQGLRLFQVPDFRVANTGFSDNVGNRTLTASNAVGAIDSCSFDGNSASSEGGALYVLGGDVSLLDCSFADNSSDLTGGAIHVQSGSVDLTGCEFDGNHAVEHGGGLSGMDATATLNFCTFTGNTADQTGGSIYTNDVATVVNQCDLSAGSAASIGGGAYHRYGSTTYLGGQIVNNTGQTGGGIATSLSAVEFTGLAVSGNTGNTGGGLVIFASELVMNDCLVTDNSADSNGGIYIHNNSTGQINGTVIAGNQGSGVTVYNGSDLSLFESTIVGNGRAGSAGQILGQLNSTVALNACIVAFGDHGPAAGVDDTTSTVVADASNIFGNVGGDWVGPLAGQGGAACNFSLDPLFCDSAAADYYLTDSSPCAAANSPCGLQVGALGIECSGPSDAPDTMLPSVFAVLGNHPNPFNPRTDIFFDLPKAGPVVVEIYDVTGRLVRRLVQGENYPAGSHQVTWDGTDDLGRSHSSGIYLYRVHATGQSLGGKMAMIR